MIGFVIVSHSARLAEGVCELAAQMGQGRVRLAPAGGTSDAANPIGTDAFKVLEAIESVYSEAGVLILMDLGSAVLSAETALELLDEEKRAHVHLFPGPVVERAVAAVSLAAAGATLREILQGPREAEIEGPLEGAVVTLEDPLGLHARPAAQFIRQARRFQSRITVENLTTCAGPADAASMQALLGLAARQGHQLRIQASGPDAARAVAELARAMARNQPAALPASAGIAIGPLVKLQSVVLRAEPRTVDDPAAEQARLSTAISRALDETRALYDRAGIFDAQALMLEDPQLINRASGLIRDERRNSEFAWQTASDEFHAGDIADVAARVLRILTKAGIAVPHLSNPSILAAHDLTPSEVQALDPSLTLGLCLESGSASAHSVILARAMGIPVVVGAGPVFAAVADGTTVALDGESGTIWISPAPPQRAELENRRREWLSARAAAESSRHQSATTRDGRRIRVLANISGVAEAATALDCGAEGIGVLRTEFLFLNRPEPPSEDEQFEAYRAIAETLGDRQLVIRTLDIGGDKSAPYVGMGTEQNPFLGWRGIRVLLDRPDLLRAQFRAILRAAAGHRVEILLPMISTLDELRQAKAILAGLGGNLPVGVMIEVPAAVAIADELAKEAAFFSIGTNDLVQYLMAADRTNARVAALADPFQPAVLRMLRQTIEAGRKAGIPVALCGEFAADTRATPLLLGLGLEEFSVSPPLIPGLKQAIGRC